MNDLLPETRALLDAGRDGEDPGAGDFDRNRRALVRKLGAGAMAASVGIASTTGAAATSVATAGALTSVILPLIVGGAVGAAAVGVAWVRDDAHKSAVAVVAPPLAASARGVAVIPPETETKAPPAPLPPRSANGDIVEPPTREGRANAPPAAPRADGLAASSGEPRTAPPRPAFVDSPPSPSPSPASVEQELALLRAAQERLHTGSAAAALALLDEHARRFPNGALSQERRASRILALCQLGKIAEGRAEADRFVAEMPTSPFVDRIRRACSP